MPALYIVCVGDFNSTDNNRYIKPIFMGHFVNARLVSQSQRSFLNYYSRNILFSTHTMRSTRWIITQNAIKMDCKWLRNQYRNLQPAHLLFSTNFFNSYHHFITGTRGINWIGHLFFYPLIRALSSSSLYISGLPQPENENMWGCDFPSAPRAGLNFLDFISEIPYRTPRYKCQLESCANEKQIVTV